jgi:hypothetical protein
VDRPKEGRGHRRQHQVNRRRRRVDPQAARRHATQTPNMVQGVTDIRHRGSDPGQQQLAGFREPDAAGGPVHQPNAEPFFQLAQPLAQAGNRDALLQRRAPEIPGTGDGDESIEIAQVQIAHCPIY